MPVLRPLALAAAACVWCIAVLGLRFHWAGHSYFTFMIWNLFLAAIPLGFAALLAKVDRWRFGAPLIAGWLLFFPNAPYVLTDLIHLRVRPGIPLWYDLLMLLSFALVSFGWASSPSQVVQVWIQRRTSRFMAWSFVGVSLLLSGFGIYLGRFLRWNSWDIASNPLALLKDIWVRFADPLAHGQTWGVTLGFGGLLLVAYLFWMFSVTSSATASATMPTEPTWTHLLLFDGICNLCDHTVQWVLAHDRRGIVKFCSIQSELGSRLYREHGYDPEHPHSMLLLTPEGSFGKSSAALELARLMGGRLAWLSWARIIPRPLCDLAYAFVARNRYRFFGQKDQCLMPRPEWKERFVG